MASVRIIVLLLLPASLYVPVQPDSNQKAALDRTPESRQLEGDADPQRQKSIAIGRVARLLDRAFDFNEIDARVKAVARLAHVAWKHDGDFARRVILRAHEQLKSYSEKPLLSEDKEERNRILIESSIALNVYVSMHDARLARELTILGAGADAEFIRTNSAMAAALRLLQSGSAPADTVAFAERALEADLRNVIALVTFLHELRGKNESLANDLFLRAVQTIGARSGPEPGGFDAFLKLGVYLFGDPRFAESEEVRFRKWAVGNALIVNLSADRPEARPELIRSYLSALVNIIERPTQALRQKSAYYAAGYMLLPKIERYASEMLPRAHLALNALSADVPQSVKDPQKYQRMGKAPDEIDLISAQNYLDKIGDDRARDLTCFRIAHSLFVKGDVKGARAIANKIVDLSSREIIINLLDSWYVAKALEEGEFTRAEETAAKLKASNESALMWLEIAAARMSAENNGMAREAINTAIRAAGSLDASKQASILLLAAVVLARFDPVDALLTLNQSVQRFNSADRREWRDDFWVKRLRFGDVVRDFAIPRRLLTDNLSGCFEKLASVNSQQVEEIALLLKQESVAGDAFVGVASAIFEEIEKGKPKADSSTRKSAR